MLVLLRNDSEILSSLNHMISFSYLLISDLYEYVNTQELELESKEFRQSATSDGEVY